MRWPGEDLGTLGLELSLDGDVTRNSGSRQATWSADCLNSASLLEHGDGLGWIAPPHLARPMDSILRGVTCTRLRACACRCRCVQENRGPTSHDMKTTMLRNSRLGKWKPCNEYTSLWLQCSTRSPTRVIVLCMERPWSTLDIPYRPKNASNSFSSVSIMLLVASACCGCLPRSNHFVFLALLLKHRSHSKETRVACQFQGQKGERAGIPCLVR